MEVIPKKWIRLFLWLSVSMIFALCLWGTVIQRPLLSDGALWNYQIIAQRGFFRDLSFYRYLTYIPQVPLWLYVKSSSNISIPFGLILFSLGYGLINFFWFLLGLIYLTVKKRTDLIFVHVLIFIGPVFSTQGFYVSIVGESIGLGVIIFWILSLENDFKKNLWTFSLGSFLLAFGYELGFLFWPLYSLIFLNRAKRAQIKNIQWKALAFISSTLFFGGMFYFFFGLGNTVIAHVNHAFMPSLLTLPSGLNALSWILVLFFPFFYLRSSWVRYIFLVSIALMVVVGYFEFFPFDIYKHSVSFYDARTTAIIKVLIMLGFYFMFQKHEISLDWKIVSHVSIMLVFVIFHEVRFNQQWLIGLENLKKKVDSFTGCKFIPMGDFNHEFGRYQVFEWTLPFHSILSRGKKDVDIILFTPRGDKWQSLDPCYLRKGETFYSPGDFPLELSPGKTFHFNL